MKGGKNKLFSLSVGPWPGPATRVGCSASCGAMSSRGVAPVTGGGGRECAGVCLELLSMEMVRVCRRAEGGPPASTALESIGVRVGRQMIERRVAAPRDRA